jgi:hypothetical protein
VQQEEDFRKHLTNLATGPGDWSTKEWCKQAVYSVTTKS